MSGPSHLGAALYEAESGWAESVSTFGTRLPILGSPDVTGLVHAKVASEFMLQHRNAGTKELLGPMGGSFKLKFYWPGHGTTCAGAVSANALETFLGNVVGLVTAAASSGDTATGGTAAVPTMTGATGFAAGSICRFGAYGDGDGGGQFYPVGSHAASNLTLLSELMDAPANGAVVYAPIMVYPDETAATITSTRFRLLTANQIYDCFGCFPMAITLAGFNPGQMRTIEVEMGVSRWLPVSATFPTTTAVTHHLPTANGGGSFLFQAVGTTTRQTFNVRDFQCTYMLGVVADDGPGGIGIYQTVTDAKRTKDTCTFSFTVDAAANSADPFWHAWWEDNLEAYLLYTFGSADTTAGCLWLPNTCHTGNKPTQTESNGINRVPITGRAYTSTTTTSDVTLAAMVMGFA